MCSQRSFTSHVDINHLSFENNDKDSAVFVPYFAFHILYNVTYCCISLGTNQNSYAIGMTIMLQTQSCFSQQNYITRLLSYVYSMFYV